MKILAFVDVHGNRKALARIKQLSAKADILLCAGDLTVFESEVVRIVKSLEGLKRQLYIIPGNHENIGLFHNLSRKFAFITDLHKKIVQISNFDIIGFGSGGFSIVDREFERFVQDYKPSGRKLILVTHAPPYNTALDRILEEHHGNKSIRGFIEQNKPEIAICGHFHENHEKEDRIGMTRVINPGPYGKIIEL